MKFSRIVFFFIFCCVSAHSHAELPSALAAAKSHTNYPAAEKAFELTPSIKEPGVIALAVHTQPSTYLYQQAFTFQIDTPAVTLHTPDFPLGEPYEDAYFGKTTLLSGDMEILLPYTTAKTTPIQLVIGFQGCLKNTLCYPPAHKTFSLTLPESDLTVFESGPAAKGLSQRLPAQQDQAFELLKTAKLATIVLTFFFFGVLLSLTPCVLPMVPILSGMILKQNNLTPLRGFLLSLCYVLGMATSYMAAGILVAALGVNLVAALQHPIVILIVSALFLLMALVTFEAITLRLPQRLQDYFTQLQSRPSHTTGFGLFMLGALSALVISPCTTAPLGGALLFIATTGQITLGATALFAMGFGMGIPLLCIGALGDRWLPKRGPWMKDIQALFGTLFVLIAVYILSRLITPALTHILYGLTLLFYAVHLGLLEPAAKGWPRIQKAMALMVALYAGFLFFEATQPQPLFFPTQNNPQTLSTDPIQPNLPFQTVTTRAAFQQHLDNARAHHQITFVMLSADWCVTCRDLHQHVLNNPQIMKRLQDAQWLLLDMTDMNRPKAPEASLLQQLQLFNPPTLLFFDATATEIPNSRIIGAVDAPGLTQHLDAILKH
jgi:thiol:disulfide interchange protein DsbD